MAGKNDGPSDPNSEWTWVVGAGCVALVGWIAWNYFTSFIVLPSFAADWVMMKLAMVVGGHDSDYSTLDRIEGHFTRRYDAGDMTWAEFVRITSAVGERARFYTIAAILGMAVLIVFKMKGDGFKRHYDLVSLMHYQSRWWRTAAPSATFNPDTAGPEWQPSRTGFEFLRDFGISDTGGKLDREACTRVFNKTLGAHWHGIRELPIHSQCIAVMAGTHAIRDMKKALALRQEVAAIYAWTEEDKRTEALNELLAPWLADKKLMDAVDKHAAKHAFVNTALMWVVNWSRQESGVMACAEFTWLKGVDRNLWYALNNCGRRAYHIEGVGCVAHYDAERITGMPLPEPRVDAAVDGVQDYLDTHMTDSATVLRPKEDY